MPSRSPLPQPRAALLPAFPGTASCAAPRRVGAEGAGGAEPVGTSSSCRALSLFPSVPGGLALFREPSAARAASDPHR